MSMWTWNEVYDEEHAAEGEPGFLYVALDENGEGWYWEADLGHMSLGSRLDPPEWVTELALAGTASTCAEAKWQAQRAAERAYIADQVWQDEQEAQMEALYDEQERWEELQRQGDLFTQAGGDAFWQSSAGGEY